jgi:signal peptidase I
VPPPHRSTTGDADEPDHPTAAEPPRGLRQRWRRLPHRTRNLVEWIVVVAGAITVALVLRLTLVGVFSIPSESMAPTLEVGDRIVVNQLADSIDDLDRGDIVVFERPDTLASGEEHLVKRIIGFPGETVEAHEGHVWIDGEELDEPWLPPGVGTDDFAAVEVPEGRLWMMGDNRSGSTDSRVFGPIDGSTVVGRVIFRFWPVTRLGGP